MGLNSEQDNDTKGVVAPAYVAFPSFKTFLKSMKENGVPSRIDRSVLRSFSGATGSQLLTGLKALGLTAADGTPTPKLQVLSDAYDTDQWSDVLEKTLRTAYAPLFALNLELATSSQFNEKFRASYPAKDATLTKCVTFFLSAVRETNIKVSPYIMANKKPRTASSAKKIKTKAPKSQDTSGNARKNNLDPPLSPPVARNNTEILMEMLDMDKMDETEQAAVWTLLRYTKKVPV